MIIESQSVPFPVLEITSNVSCLSPRFATYLEKRMLRLVQRLGTHPEYGKWTLEKIFGEILGLPEVEEFLRPTLDELINSRALECENDHQELSVLRLCDFSITATGLDFLKAGQLPSRARSFKARHLFDPISNQLTPIKGKTPGHLHDEDGPIAFDSFMEHFPEGKIRESIPLEKIDWWTPGIEIREIEKENSRTLFERERMNLVLKRDGHLLCEGSNPKRAEHVELGGIPLEEFFAKLANSIDEATDSDHPEKSVQELFQLGAKVNVAKASIVPRKEGLWLFDGSPQGMPSLDAADLPEGSAVIIFGATGCQSVKWNENRNSCILSVPDPFPWKQLGKVVDPDGLSTADCLTSVLVNKRECKVSLRYEYKALTNEQISTDLKLLTGKIIDGLDPKDWVIAGTWLETEELINFASDQFLTGMKEIEEQEKAIAGFCKSAGKALWIEKAPKMNRMQAEIFCRQVNQEPCVSADALLGISRKITALMLEEKVRKALVNSIEKSVQSKTIDENLAAKLKHEIFEKENQSKDKGKKPREKTVGDRSAFTQTRKKTEQKGKRRKKTNHFKYQGNRKKS